MTAIRLPGDQADQTLVESCLEKMLDSPLFSASPRQQDLLRYLVTQTLTGKADRLKGYVVGVEVFGRGADFDPAVDAIVRVEVGRLRTRLREYYQGDGQGDAVCFELPKGGYAVQFRLPEAQLQTSSPGGAARRDPHLLENKPTLAVLPLANISAEIGQDYFVDGITDNLIFELSRLSGLFVISRQSSFAYRGSAKSSEVIASELGVKFLLEGSVQRSGSRIRVTAQLVEASSGGHVWSERFESDIQDIFALQDQVTRSIVNALQIRLAPAEAEMFGHEGTGNIEAHESLLRGLECHWKFSPKFIAEARRHFGHAVECDPSYAAAHAWLARSMLHQWIMKWDDTPGLREQAMEHARKAVALDTHLPYAMAILGWVNLWSKQREPAIAYCRQAVARDPNNPELLNFLSMALSSSGHGEEGLFYVEKARRLNPHSSPFYEFVLGQAYFVLEDYDKAIAAFQHGCTLSETFIPNHAYLCVTYALLGMEERMCEKRNFVKMLTGGDSSRIIESPWIDEKLAALYQHLLHVAGLR
jgi:adenylate cyclase